MNPNTRSEMGEIRRANSADAARIAALGMLVWLHTYAREGISDAMARHVLGNLNEAQIARLIADPARCVLLAEHCGNLLAYAVLHFGAGHRGIGCEVETLYVHPAQARRGIGRVLVRRAQEQALTQSGKAAIWLTANAQNLGAIAFYRALGFVDEGERWFELDGTQHLNRLLVLD